MVVAHDHGSNDYNSPFDLVISYSEIPTPSGSEVQICYTIGSIDPPPPDPDPSSTLYTASIPIDRNTIVKAIAIDEAGNASTVVTQTYTYLRIDSANPSVCSKSTPINNSILYGFFFDYTVVNQNNGDSVSTPITIDP